MRLSRFFYGAVIYIFGVVGVCGGCGGYIYRIFILLVRPYYICPHTHFVLDITHSPTRINTTNMVAVIRQCDHSVINRTNVRQDVTRSNNVIFEQFSAIFPSSFCLSLAIT